MPSYFIERLNYNRHVHIDVTTRVICLYRYGADRSRRRGLRDFSDQHFTEQSLDRCAGDHRTMLTLGRSASNDWARHQREYPQGTVKPRQAFGRTAGVTASAHLRDSNSSSTQLGLIQVDVVSGKC